MVEMSYITYNWHYDGQIYPKHYVGQITSEDENTYYVVLPNGEKRYLGKQYMTDFRVEPYTGQVKPDPIWGWDHTK